MPSPLRLPRQNYQSLMQDLRLASCPSRFPPRPRVSCEDEKSRISLELREQRMTRITLHCFNHAITIILGIHNILNLKMVVRSIILRHLWGQKFSFRVTPVHIRSITTQPAKKVLSTTPAPPPTEQKSWLTRKVETSPAARRVFVGLTNLLGYGSPKQVAGRRALLFYEQVCAVKPDEDSLFWQKGALFHSFRYPLFRSCVLARQHVGLNLSSYVHLYPLHSATTMAQPDWDMHVEISCCFHFLIFFRYFVHSCPNLLSFQFLVTDSSFSLFILSNALKPLYRMLFTTNFPIMVHHNQPAHLDAHGPLACPPILARTILRTSPNRPLLHRYRRPHPHRPPTPRRTHKAIHVPHVLLCQPQRAVS